jgi:hypothetical protein
VPWFGTFLAGMSVLASVVFITSLQRTEGRERQGEQARERERRRKIAGVYGEGPAPPRRLCVAARFFFSFFSRFSWNQPTPSLPTNQQPYQTAAGRNCCLSLRRVRMLLFSSPHAGAGPAPHHSPAGRVTSPMRILKTPFHAPPSACLRKKDRSY